MKAKNKGLCNGTWYNVYRISDYDENIGLCRDGVWGSFVFCTFEKIVKSDTDTDQTQDQTKKLIIY